MTKDGEDTRADSEVRSGEGQSQRVRAEGSEILATVLDRQESKGRRRQ